MGTGLLCRPSAMMETHCLEMAAAPPAQFRTTFLAISSVLRVTAGISATHWIGRFSTVLVKMHFSLKSAATMTFPTLSSTLPAHLGGNCCEKR